MKKVGYLLGVGKSTLGNQILGGNDAFARGHAMTSKTSNISIGVGNYLGTGKCFSIIDTPGASDTEGKMFCLCLLRLSPW